MGQAAGGRTDGKAGGQGGGRCRRVTDRANRSTFFYAYRFIDADQLPLILFSPEITTNRKPAVGRGMGVGRAGQRAAGAWRAVATAAAAAGSAVNATVLE